MKAFIIRLLSVLVFTCFCSMILWQYFTYSHTGLRGPRNAQEMPNRDAALSDPQSVKKNQANKNNVGYIVRRIVKRKKVKNNDVAAGDPRKLNPNQVKPNPNQVKPNPNQVKPNPNQVKPNPNQVKPNPAKSHDAAASDPHKVKKNSANSKESIIIDSLLANYTSNWKKQERNIQSFRYSLSKSCNAIYNATVTKVNSPVGMKFTYDGDNKKTMEVTQTLFDLFPQETPFKNAPWDTCAVVGNGGILANSSCGKQIDSATFVIRCNLPPVNNGHQRDTGSKTNLVTANPSILVERYRALNEHRRSFVEDMQRYGNALLFLPAFSFRRNTAVSLRALYSLEDLNIHGPQPVFFNPGYLNSLADFWRGQGVRSLRLSTGIMMASLAVELCNNVHLYGFWPFGKHPFTHQQLNNHYYDNRPVNKRLHAMPAEFEALLNLHNKGVIHLHLGECTK